VIQHRVCVALAIVAASFLSGWKVNAWKNDAAMLKMQKEMEKAQREYKSQETKKAQELQGQLQTLRKKERALKNEVFQLIQKPIYQRDCFDNDGLLLINKAINGNNTRNPSTELR